jgi:hypothetical protein
MSSSGIDEIVPVDIGIGGPEKRLHGLTSLALSRPWWLLPNHDMF